AILLSVDAPGRIEVAQCMEPGVFRPARPGDDAGSNPDRDQAALDDVGELLDSAVVVGEGQVEIALWAGELPRAQDIDQYRGKRDGALAGLRLRWSDLAVPIGPLTDVEFATPEVDIGPGQAAQLRGAQAGEDGGQEERAPTGVLVERASDGADLVRG